MVRYSFAPIGGVGRAVTGQGVPISDNTEPWWLLGKSPRFSSHLPLFDHRALQRLLKCFECVRQASILSCVARGWTERLAVAEQGVSIIVIEIKLYEHSVGIL